MRNRKSAISFILIIAIVMSLGTTLVFGQDEVIGFDSIKSSSEDGSLYEDESADLTGTVKSLASGGSIELGLYTSPGGLEQTTTIDEGNSEILSWNFKAILPKAGNYDEGYYTVKIMGSGDESLIAKSPEFSVLSKDKAKAEVETKGILKPEAKAEALNPNATTQTALTTHTAISADGDISVTFSTTGAIATPCSVKLTPLTDKQIKDMLDGEEGLYDVHSIGDVSVLDKNGSEIKVTSASAIFDLNTLLKGSIPLDYEYNDEYLDYYEDDYEEYNYWDDDDFDDDYKFTVGQSQMFYDFAGELFVYNSEEDRFYNEDHTKYYYYADEVDYNDIDEYTDEDDESYDEDEESYDEDDESYDDDAASYDGDDESYDEDEESYDEDDESYDEDEYYDVYYSNDGKYYYYFEDDWYYDPDMEDGCFFDEYYNIYYVQGRCYYYDKDKDAYFIDEKFEAEHPEYIDNMKLWLDENGNDSVSYWDHWFAYIEKYDLYAMNGNYYYKDGDALYFDKDFNTYSLYSDGTYYYFDYERDLEFTKDESGKRAFVNPKEVGYDFYYGFDEYPEYKANQDMTSYDGYGEGNEFSVKNGTEVRFVEAEKNSGTDWVRIVSPEYVQYTKEKEEKMNGKRDRFYFSYWGGIFNDYNVDGKGYVIDHVGYTRLNNITPVLNTYKSGMIHLNESDGKVDSFKSELTKDNKLKVENASFSPVMVASQRDDVSEAPSDSAAAEGDSGRGVLGKRYSYNTSDSSNMIIWVVLGIMAMLGFCATTFYYGKRDSRYI